MPLLEVTDAATGKDVAVPGDAVNGIKVQVTSGGTSNGLTDAQLRATAVPVSGPLTAAQLAALEPLGVSAAALPLPAGASTSAAQTTGNTSLASIDTKLPALSGGKVPITTDGLTDTQLRATPVPVSGTVTITDGSGPVTVDGTVAATVADGSDVAQGAKADAAVTDYTASASLVAALKGLLKLLGPSTAGGQGNKVVTTAATPVQLAGSTACTNVIITARVGNTKEIAYGFSNAVRATAGSEIGAQLQPGDSVSLKINNLNAIWLDAQVNGEGVSFTYTTD